MSILHIFDHSLPLQSGYVYRSLALLQGQKNLGYEVRAVTSSRQKQNLPPLQENFADIDFFRTKSTNISLPIFKEMQDMAYLYQRIKQVMEQGKPEIIHVHSPVLNFFPAHCAAQKYNIPVVYEIRAFWEDAAVDHGTTTENSLRYKATRFLETKAAKKADHVFTICNGLKQDLVKRGIKEDKITIVPNSIDNSRFKILKEKDSALEKELGLEDKIVLGFIGSFYHYEGLDRLVEAMPQLLKYNPNIRLLLVGGGVEEERLKQKIQALGLESFVMTIGRVPHHLVESYYSVCDALVFPRYKIRLTDLVTPLKPLEAMAMGKIVMASNIGGHRELIEDGKNGYLVENDNAHQLAEGIIEILKQQHLWAGVILAARDYVEQKHDNIAIASYYRLIYDKILS